MKQEQASLLVQTLVLVGMGMGKLNVIKNAICGQGAINLM